MAEDNNKKRCVYFVTAYSYMNEKVGVNPFHRKVIECEEITSIKQILDIEEYMGKYYKVVFFTRLGEEKKE